MKTCKFYKNHGRRARHCLKIGKSIWLWVIISTPAKILYLLLNLEDSTVLTSSSIAILNSTSSLSKILLYVLHSSDIFIFFCEIKLVQQSKPLKLSKKMTYQLKFTMNVTWLSWGCAGFWLADFLSNSSMARNKKTPRMGEGKRALQVRSRADVYLEQEPPVLVAPQFQK